MFKIKDNKTMRVLVYPNTMNIPSLYRILWKTYTLCGNYWRKYKTNDFEKDTDKGYELLSQKYEQEMTAPYKMKNILLENKITLNYMMKENSLYYEKKRNNKTPPRSHHELWWRIVTLL